MQHEHDDHPVTNEAIEAMVSLTVQLRSRRQSVPIEELATEVVDATFPTCVTGSADPNAPERAPAHAASRRSDSERIRASRFRPSWRNRVMQSM
jgi:hypothetical protein